MEQATRLLASMIVLGALAACGKSAGDAQKTGQAAPAPAVVVAKAEQKDVHSSQQFTGRVQAVDDVQLIARVQGFLDKRLFEEGAVVHQGQLLFVIDQRPFQVTVEQRAADLDRAKAAAADAKVQFERGTELLRSARSP